MSMGGTTSSLKMLGDENISRQQGDRCLKKKVSKHFDMSDLFS